MANLGNLMSSRRRGQEVIRTSCEPRGTAALAPVNSATIFMHFHYFCSQEDDGKDSLLSKQCHFNV